MKKKLKLYNHFHNGDIFYSRVLVEMLKDYFDLEYYHNQRVPLFKDIPEIKEYSGVDSSFPMKTSLTSKGIVNTWIGHNFYIHGHKVNLGCTYENYLILSKNIVSELGLQISDREYLPKIYVNNLPDYDRIDLIMKDYKKNFEKIVLFSDGPVLSGQAPLFDFTEHIKNISEKYPNYLFFVTQGEPFESPNIVDTNTITQKIPDLLEIGLISQYCDVIVGRASGPYCFAQNENNLMDPNKTFLCFCNTFTEGKYYQNMKSRFLWSPTNNGEIIYDMIEKSLNN